MPVDDRELYHYGIKGMKWGVRKKPHIGDIRIERGSTIKRVSDNKENKRNNNKRSAYVSTNKKDHEVYKNKFARQYALTENKKDIYQISFKAQNDLISPSKSRRMKLYNELQKKR